MIHDPGFLDLGGFLAVFGEPRARLEQAAARPARVLDGFGRVVTAVAVHRGELVRLLRLRAAARDARLWAFRQWLRDSEGFSARTARDCISEVGAAIADTGGQPEVMAVNMARGMRYRRRLGRWLELLTRYLLGIENVDDRIESWAWNIRSFLELSAPRRQPAPWRDEPPRRPPRELTEDEESALAAQVRARRGFGDHPAWAWPVLELLLCSGAGIAELVRLERRSVEVAIAAIDGGSELVFLDVPRGGGRRRRMIADWAVEPLRALLSWSLPWETVADIVSPSSPVTNRQRRAAEIVGRALQSACEDAGVEWNRYTTAAIRGCVLRELRESFPDRVDSEPEVMASLLGIDPRRLRPRSGDGHGR